MKFSFALLLSYALALPTLKPVSDMQEIEMSVVDGGSNSENSVATETVPIASRHGSEGSAAHPPLTLAGTAKPTLVFDQVPSKDHPAVNLAAMTNHYVYGPEQLATMTLAATAKPTAVVEQVPRIYNPRNCPTAPRMQPMQRVNAPYAGAGNNCNPTFCPCIIPTDCGGCGECTAGACEACAEGTAECIGNCCTGFVGPCCAECAGPCCMACCEGCLKGPCIC